MFSCSIFLTIYESSEILTSLYRGDTGCELETNIVYYTIIFMISYKPHSCECMNSVFVVYLFT